MFLKLQRRISEELYFWRLLPYPVRTDARLHKNQPPAEGTRSAHIPLLVWQLTREKKHRPCWHLLLPDRLHAGLSADKLFPNARGVKVAVTHPEARCVSDTAWQTASLPDRLSRGGVKAGGVQSWAWQFRCRPARALSGPDTQTRLLFALLCCKFQSTI